MEKNLYIVRCGEVALKGMNKPYFERVLLERVKNALACYEDAEAKWIDGLMFVRVPSDIPEDEVISKCVRVFGVASVSPAVEAPKDIKVSRESDAGEEASVKVDFSRETGPVKPMHGVGQLLAPLRPVHLQTAQGVLCAQVFKPRMRPLCKCYRSLHLDGDCPVSLLK